MTAVGTKRTIPIGPKKVVEEQVAREVTSTKMSFSYAIINENDNPFDVKGYRADVCVMPLTEDKNKCICTWSASWASAGAAIDNLPKLIRSGIAAGEKKAAKKSNL